MRLTNLWSDCAATALAVAQDEERKARDLEADPRANELDIIRHQALALKARVAAAKFMKNLLTEV